ncbi:MAG: 30S ribosomal protein S7 [Candidatus Pacebacteria bacterium]|nr:30S ribosomal protein S7 [Candidatus Paceibacterota bacterium]
MSQKFKTREIFPDSVHDSVIVSKFINTIMERGKKSVARKIVYGAFDIIKEQTKQEPMDILERALEEAAPKVEVRPQRVGGATYQVPREVKDKRALSLAMRWLIDSAQKKKGKTMAVRLADEIIQASKAEGEAVKKKINVHKMAEANKAFAYLAR